MPTKLTDEQRVRAAVPDAVCAWGCTRFEVAAPSYMGGRLILGSGKDVPSAWHATLQHPTVQAHERKSEHMADTPELPEMDVTEEEKALGRSKVFAMFGEGRSDLTRELINSEAELFCRERQLREAHATIAALRYSAERSDKDWVSMDEHLKACEALRAPLTGPAMEALVRACAEAVWQMYREPHNLTENALKERTFEALLALLLSTHNPLLERIRELEAERDGIRDVLRDMAVFHGPAPVNDAEDCLLVAARQVVALITELRVTRRALDFGCHHGEIEPWQALESARKELEAE